MAAINRLVTSEDANELSALAQAFASDIVSQLEEVVAKSRGGDRAAIRLYVQAWRALGPRVLLAFEQAGADFVAHTDEGVVLIDAKGRPSRDLTDLVVQEALHAPFSAWVQAIGDGPGVAVHLIASIRRLTGGRPIDLPETFVQPLLFAEESDSLEVRRFLRFAYRELEAESDPLDRIADLFALTDTDLGRLFGVSRQRIAQWRFEGVPMAHQPKLTATARIADLLEHNLISERIPGIVRRAAPEFENKSLLEAIEHDQHEQVLRRVEDSFDWATTA